MRLSKHLMAAGSLFALLPGLAYATEFDAYGQAPADLVRADAKHDVTIELGLGIGTAPAYEGASEYGMTFNPIINVERLNIPGLIDIGGESKKAGGFKFAPSISVATERKSADFAALNGLNNIEATYAIGGRVGYEMVFADGLSAQIYGAARYAFGGAHGLIGEVGIDLTAKLTPELTIIGGPVVNLASDNYMDTYFGVTSAESAATRGRLGAFDPTGGIKSVGVKVAAKYEFAPDTFLNLNASYSRYVGEALNSPIVKSGSESQATVGVGLSRRFSFDY